MGGAGAAGDWAVTTGGGGGPPAPVGRGPIGGGDIWFSGIVCGRIPPPLPAPPIGGAGGATEGRGFWSGALSSGS